MKWTDVTDIAQALYDKFPDINPNIIRFTQLHHWIVSLEAFDDDPKRGGEKCLEAIQQLWIEEAA